MILAAMMLLGGLAASATGKQQDFLRSITDGDFDGTLSSEVVPVPNSESYAQLAKDGKTINQYNFKTGKLEKTLLDVSKTIGQKKIAKVEGFEYCADGTMMLVYTNKEKAFRRSFAADFYTFDVQRNKLEKVSEGKQNMATLSPNGLFVIFAKGNDIYLKKMLYGTESRMTNLGDDGNTFSGIMDWMYEEEFGKTNQIIWSPDCRYVVFVGLDDAKIGKQTIETFPLNPDDDNLYPATKSFKYAKAGGVNSTPSLYVYDVFYTKLTKIDMPFDDDTYIPKIQWTNDMENFMAFTLNRNQDRMRMYKINCKSQIHTMLIQEQAKHCYDYRNFGYVRFLNDGKFTLASEQDGHRHIYLYHPNGILFKQLTKGNFDVTKFYGCDTAKNVFFYQAAEVSPRGREVYSVDEKGSQSLLSEKKGYNDAVFSPQGTSFLLESSSLDKPATYTLCSASGKKEKELEGNATLSQQIGNLPKKDFFDIKTAAGDTLVGWMLKPAGFDARKKYPVVMIVYGAPDYQTVTDRYSFDWEYALANEGVIVVSVDGHGSGARGEAWRNSTYEQLGVLEAKDQVAAANYLKELSYVKKDAIGIFGWSYGGFETLMSMSTGEKVFAAGVAVAPVTDWHFYDNIYTERYMRRPQENGRYDASSPIKLVNKLNGKLLLVHGTADDNVHIENTYAYANALINANKQFDMQIYPNCDHSINGDNVRYHLYTKVINFFLDNLK